MTSHEQERAPPRDEIGTGGADRSYVFRTAISFVIGAIFLLAIATIWFAGNVLLLVFASILIAVLLNGVTNKLMDWTPLPHGAALAVVLLLLAIVLGFSAYLLAPRVASQIDPLISTLPSSIQKLRSYLDQYGWFQNILQSIPPIGELLSSASGMLSQARAVFSGALGAVANIFIVLFVGIYLAAQPQVYIRGFLKLVPKKNRPRGRAVLEELGTTLELWLLGKTLSMVVVGVSTAIGLTFLGVPLAVTLGVIAGLLDFIPYLGPIMAGVPAVLMAFSESPTTALYVVFLFIALQSVESYLLAPLVDRKTVSLPPALTITMQILFAVPFGLLGIALASPLTAALFVLIAMLYVQDVLGDPVQTPGDNHDQ